MKRLIVLQPALKLWLASTALTAAIAMIGAGQVWAAPWNFIYFTDPHVAKTSGFDIDGVNFDSMSHYISRLTVKPSFVVVAGDLANGANDNDYAALTKHMSFSDNTWNVKNATGNSTGIPIYFTPGNHDTRVFGWPLIGNLGFYDYHIKYEKSKPWPHQPGSTTRCAFGTTADAAHDYYFCYNNTALVICLFSGYDDNRSDLGWPRGTGLKNDQMAFFNKAIKDNVSKNPKIVVMHHPPVNSTYNMGTIQDNTNRKAFIDTCEKYNITVLSGHHHLGRRMDKNGTVTAAGRYVLTRGSWGGYLRVVTVDGGNITVGDETNSQNVLPTALITSPFDGQVKEFNGLAWTVKVNAMSNMSGVQIDKVEVSLDGVLKKTVIRTLYNQTEFVTDIDPPPSKVVNHVIGAKVYAGNKTNTASITVITGASSYYNKMNVWGTANITDPYNGHVLTFTLAGLDQYVRKAQFSVKDNTTNTTWTEFVNDKQMKKLGNNSNLVIYAGQIVGTTYAEIMIAPYQYPSVDIIVPAAGAGTGNCLVQVATNYTGKNVPWQGSGNPYSATDRLKELVYNSNYHTTAEDYWWCMTGTAGNRTLTVALRDSLGTTVSKSVTINYDPAKYPAYVYQGPYGDYYKIFSIWPSSNNTVANWEIKYGPSGPDYTYSGNFGISPNVGIGTNTRDGEIYQYAWYLWHNVTRHNIPSGGTGVYVVDKNQYLTGSFNSCLGYSPAITYKELYEKLASLLGKDNTGKWRVWASASPATRKSTDAINFAPMPPTLLSPANNAGNVATNPTISWNASYDAITYHFQLSSNSSFSSLIYDQAGLTTTSRAISGLSRGTTYYWRVRAYNSSGFSAWAPVYSFYTINYPTVVTLNSPGYNAIGIGTSTTLKWNADPYAASYTLQVSTNSSFSSYVYNQADITATSKDISGLSMGTTYYWRVRSTNSMGTSAWSVVRPFTTNITGSNNTSGSVGWGYTTAITRDIVISGFSTKKIASMQVVFSGIYTSYYSSFTLNGVSLTGNSISGVYNFYPTNWNGSYADGTYRLRMSTIYYPLTFNYWTLIINCESAVKGDAGSADEISLNRPFMPAVTKLLPGAPNPFTGQSAINFQLAVPAQTSITVYNIAGQKVKTLVNECLRPGYHSVKWDGKSDNDQKVAAGVYLYRMQAGDYSKTMKLTVLR